MTVFYRFTQTHTCMCTNVGDPLVPRDRHHPARLPFISLWAKKGLVVIIHVGRTDLISMTARSRVDTMYILVHADTPFYALHSFLTYVKNLCTSMYAEPPE